MRVKKFPAYILLCCEFVRRSTYIIYHLLRTLLGCFMKSPQLLQDELNNMTWHEVQRRLLDVQKEQQMCIHKLELTQLG